MIDGCRAFDFRRFVRIIGTNGKIERESTALVETLERMELVGNLVGHIPGLVTTDCDHDRSQKIDHSKITDLIPHPEICAA